MAEEQIRFDDADQSGPATCAACRRAIRDEYWSAGSVVVCPQCKAQHQASDVNHNVLVGTIVGGSMGLAGGLAGAVVWYLVARLANLQIGIIAILVGWLVGKGVASGTGHRGGRWYQILAVLITYLSIGVAYASLILTLGAPEGMEDLGVFKYPAALMLGLIAPVAMVFSDVTALISLLIIFFGLSQAWRMNRRADIAWSGPHHLAPNITPPPLASPPAPPSPPPLPPRDGEAT